jgi:hypothetical protein
MTADIPDRPKDPAPVTQPDESTGVAIEGVVGRLQGAAVLRH